MTTPRPDGLHHGHLDTADDVRAENDKLPKNKQKTLTDDDIGKEIKKRRNLTPACAARKVFVALNMKRVSEVDNIQDTVRLLSAILRTCREHPEHVFSDWLPTESDFKSYYKAKSESKRLKNLAILMDWEPRWCPHLEFQNMIEQHVKEWELDPEEGYYRKQNFKDFGQDKRDKSPQGQFDCTKDKFLRAGTCL